MEAWLETFAMLALLSGIGSLSAGAEWYTESETDPIDDTRSVVALRLERPGQWTRTGRHRLLFLSCEEPRPNEEPSLQAVIAWNMTAGNLLDPVDVEWQDASPTTTEILTRFGDERAQNWTYDHVGTGNEMFATIPHDVDRFLTKAKRATEVALRVEHDVTGTQTTVFDLTGSARVIEAMENGCKSPGRPPSKRKPRSPRKRKPKPAPDAFDTLLRDLERQRKTAPPKLRREQARPELRPALLSEEGVLASLSADDRAWIEASCPRELGPASWSRCIQREVEAVRRGTPDISNLAAHHQAWIESSCPRHSGPALWSRCVEREVKAVRRGMPDISNLAAHHQTWIESSCPRHSGPALWSRCVEREVEAVRRGIPDISNLAADHQTWIKSSCPRHSGPALWSRCVEREVEAVRRGMPDISNLAAHHQAWIKSSCPRHSGPALWSRCVRREVEAIRTKQHQ